MSYWLLSQAHRYYPVHSHPFCTPCPRLDTLTHTPTPQCAWHQTWPTSRCVPLAVFSDSCCEGDTAGSAVLNAQAEGSLRLAHNPHFLRSHAPLLPIPLTHTHTVHHHNRSLSSTGKALMIGASGRRSSTPSSSTHSASTASTCTLCTSHATTRTRCLCCCCTAGQAASLSSTG